MSQEYGGQRSSKAAQICVRGRSPNYRERQVQCCSGTEELVSMRREHVAQERQLIPADANVALI